MDMQKKILRHQTSQAYRIGTTRIIVFGWLLLAGPLNTVNVIYMQMLFIRTWDIGWTVEADCWC